MLSICISPISIYSIKGSSLAQRNAFSKLPYFSLDLSFFWGATSWMIFTCLYVLLGSNIKLINNLFWWCVNPFNWLVLYYFIKLRPSLPRLFYPGQVHCQSYFWIRHCFYVIECEPFCLCNEPEWAIQFYKCKS